MLKANAQTSGRRPWPFKRAVVAASVSFVLALGAEAGAALPCAYASESATGIVRPDGSSEVVRVSSCSSMLEHHGTGVLLWLGIPVVLSGAGVVSAARGMRKPQAVIGWTIVAASFVFTVLSFAFFPMYYAPAGLALIVSAAQEPAT